MTKEQFLDKWRFGSNPLFEADLEAVIATEIAKVQEQPQPSDKVQISKHTLVEVNRAFRALKQDRNSYVHKVFSDDGVFDAMKEISEAYKYYFGEQPQEKPTPNPIEQAYHAFQPIRYILWKKGWRIKKHSDTESIDANGRIFNNTCFVFNFATHPEKWELCTEPAEQPAPKQKITPTDDDIKNGLQKLGDIIAKPNPTEQPAKPFDKERFEAMFRSVVANGGHELDHKQAIELTEEALKQLDAYYAEKEGGNNG